MKLNHDCIRAILCHFESTTNITVNEDGVEIDPIPIEAFYKGLPKFDKANIYYSLCILEDVGFIVAASQYGDDGISDFLVERMTYEGHEYLESIRDAKTWASVKKALGKIGNASLNVISAIAEGITSAAIDKYLKGELTI